MAPARFMAIRGMKIQRFLPILFTLLAVGCTPSKQKVTVSADANPQRITFPAGADQDHIEIDVSAKGAFIPASINGQPPRPFLFDSGSTGNGITVSIAEELGLTRLDAKIKHHTGQTVSEVSLYYAETLQIGQITFHDVSFMAHDPETEISKKPTQLLGYLLFQETPFTLDLANGQLSIFKNPPTHIKGWSQLETNEFRLPQVRAKFLHPDTGAPIVEFPAFIDTGAKSAGSATITMPKSVPASDPRIRPFLEGDGKPLTTHTAIASNRNTYFPAEFKLDFGPAEGEGKFILIFENKDQGSFAFDNRGILELSIFKDSALTFDIPNNRWAVSFP